MHTHTHTHMHTHTHTHTYTHMHAHTHTHAHTQHSQGKIPVGYRFLAKSSSEQSHEIPIEGFELAEKDYRLVLSELERFLCPDGTELPPLFAKVLNIRECSVYSVVHYPTTFPITHLV